MGFFITLLWYAFFFVLSELLTPKPELENAKPSGLGDFQFPTATEGRPVPIIWGTVKQKGPNVVWYGDFLQEPIKENVSTGLFSSEQIIKGFRYHLGVQFALCRGDDDTTLRRLWIGDILIDIGGPIDGGDTFTVDCPGLFGGEELGHGGVIGTLRFHNGSQSQAVSPYLANFQQQGGDTPRYVGTCYVDPAAIRIYLGNSTSIKPWAFEVRRIPNPLGLSASEAALNNGNDVNLVSVVYEILTNGEWGLGQATASIDTANFAAAASTLATEENGFSYLLDRQMEASELLKLVEEQMDGVVFQNPSSGKWQVKLARDDYDIDTVPQVTPSNMVELITFGRGSWEDTRNQVRIKYNDRDDEYKETYGLAQDTANIRVLQGANVSITQNFPGVKSGPTANFIAWRQLRTLSNPLAKATVIVNRTFWDITPGSVIALSNTTLGIVKMPMRVTRARLGSLTDGRIRLELVQDVFTSQPPSYSNPVATGWISPADTLLPYATTEQTAFEAPRALVVRDPHAIGIEPRIYASARQKGVEVGCRFKQRNASGTPGGSYSTAQTIYGPLARIGNLNANLAIGSTVPASTIILSASPDSNTEIESLINDIENPVGDLGSELVNLCVIDPGGTNEEYILVSGAQVSGANVQLNNVYRGALDSVQRAHTAGDPVWLLFVAGGISTVSIDPTHSVEAKLLPFSATDEVDIGDATSITFDMDERISRPYPPSEVSLGGTRFATSAALEGTGADAEDFGITTVINRRDFRTMNEVNSLTVDAEDIDSTFPATNSTVHDIAVRADPDGTNTLLFTEEDVAGVSVDILRLKMLRFNAGAVPVRLRYEISAKHTVSTTEFSSRTPLRFDFNVTTALTGQFVFGALDANVTSAIYTATVAGTYNFTLSSAFSVGLVEHRINGGAWTTLITATTTSGSIVGVSISDTIEVRHTSTDTDSLKQLDMAAAGAGQDGFAILYT